MSWNERWFLLKLVELLTITQWVEVRGDLWWYWWNCWLSLNELKWEVICGSYWWNCWPSLNELNRGVIFVDIGGGIVDHHFNELWWEVIVILVELLTITQWVKVRGDFFSYWWEVIVVDIGGIVDNHSMSYGERCIFVDIGGIVDHHSMSWGERWFLLILLELLTIIQWVEVRGDFGWYWWNCWPSLNEFRWEVIFVDIGGIVDHHSMWLGERWFLLILVELLTIT